MNPVKRAVVRTKQFVSDHKVAIAVGATATATAVVCVKLAKRAAENSESDSLVEQGLLEEVVASE